MTESEGIDERILVVNGIGSKMGGCFLEIQHKTLYFIKDVHSAERSLEETINSLLSLFIPTKVALAARIDEAVISIVSDQALEQGYSLELLGSKAFSSEWCNDIIKELMYTNDGVTTPFFPLLSDIIYDKLMPLAKNSIQALKSIVENIHIDQDMDFIFTDFVKDIQIQIPENHMYIERDTLYDIQLFKTLDEQGKKSCVFDLMNHTASYNGNKVLTSWFLAPLSNIDLINERLDIVECLTSDNNMKVLGEIMRSMKLIPNIVQTLSSLQEGKSQLNEWTKLLNFLQNSLELLSLIQQLHQAKPLPFLREILELCDPKVISQLLHRLTNTIDFELSKDWKRVYVRDGFNEELDELKIRYNDLENVLRDLAYELSLRYAHIPEDALNMVYIPQLGYLISLDCDNTSKIPDSWEEIFQTTTNIYFKDEVTKDMDNNYGDVYQMIIDLEIEILFDLQLKALTYEHVLVKLGLSFGKLDAFCALAKSTLLLDLTKPKFVEEPVLIVENGRNLVIEQQVSSFIANKIDLSTRNVSVITGANASGKSVYLAQIGMISYLAHIGSFVPATSCEIGIMDKILTKAITVESIERNESFFQKDLLKVSKMLNLKTERSLLLIDEFGKGTDTLGGPSLLGAIIEKLSESNIGTRSVFSSHFHELFKEGILKASVNINHFHMDVLFTKKHNDSNDGDELTYLFQLKSGLAHDSFGIKYVFIPSTLYKSFLTF